MKNKTILIVLSLLITAGLVPAAMAEAETVNRNLLYAQEDTYVADIESYQGQLYILRSEGLFAYDAAAGEERLVTEAVTSDYERENNIDLLLAGEDGLYGLKTSKRKLGGDCLHLGRGGGFYQRGLPAGGQALPEDP